MANRDGNLTKAYYGNAGAEATNELTGISEDSIPTTGVEAEVTTKGAIFKQYATVMHDAPCTFKILWDSANAGHTALRTAHEDKTLISLLFLDGAKNVAGHYGIGGDFTVTGFERDAPIEGKLAYSVTVKPGQSSAYPVDFRVSSGS